MASNFSRVITAVVFHFDAQVEDGLDLGLDDILWQAFIRDGLRHLAAQAAGLLEDGHLVPAQGQLPGRRKTADARPDDGVFFAGRRGNGRGGKFHRIPAQRADQDGIIDLLAGAGSHAGIGTGCAADRSGERVVLPDKFQRFVQFALAEQVDAILGRDADRAGRLAGRVEGGIAPDRRIGPVCPGRDQRRDLAGVFDDIPEQPAGDPLVGRKSCMDDAPG